MGQVIAVAAGFEPLVLRSQLHAFLPPQQAQGNPPQHRQVLVPMILSHPALILIERHVQTPMLAVLDGPVVADQARQ